MIGVVYNCILDEMYSAVTGCGATCNGKPIKVSGQTGNGYGKKVMWIL